MLGVEDLKEFMQIDIHDVNREDLMKYDDVISLLNNASEDKRQAILESPVNPYIYEDKGYVVKCVFKDDTTLSYADCTKQLVAKRAGIV